MKVIIATVLGLLLINGAGMVQAEKATIDVPFDSVGTSCWYDEVKIEYHCTWEGMIQVFTLEDLKEYQDVLSNEIYDQEIEKLNQKALEEIAAEKAKLTPNEKIIAAIEVKLDRGVATASDSVLRNLLLDLDKCYQGMDRTAAIQTYREFEISGFKQLEANNVKIDGLLGKIAMSIQECKAQKEVFKLAVGYENMLTGEDDYQFSLQDKFTPDIQSIPFEKFTRTTLEIDRSAICKDSQHHDQYKEQFGCKVLYNGIDEAEIKRQNEIRFGTDGIVKYQSQLLTDYNKFMSEYGNKHATAQDKQIQADIAEPIANEWKKDHNFYQNSLK
tara:strand:+ start:772 stop:1758 length:987 start_codon:yes stop_codon:yes gene_type:complete